MAVISILVFKVRNMQIKKVVGTAGISVIVFGSTVSPTFAARHRVVNARNNFEISLNSKYREILKTADFNAWKTFADKKFTSIEGRRLLEKVNSSEKFERFIKSIFLLKEGNYQEARKMREELGIVGGLRYNMRMLR